MQAGVRVFQLLKIRNQASSRTLRNYGLYFALTLFLTYYLTPFIKVKGLLISVMIAAALFCGERQFFPQVKNTMSSMHFLTIPSQQWEKWLAEFIHTFLIIPLIALIPVLLAIFMVNLFSPSLSNTEITLATVFLAVKKYWLLHPVLFFSAIYFRHSILIKTFGYAALLAIASALFVAALANIFLPLNQHQALANHSDIPALQLVYHQHFSTILLVAYPLFFWVMSYLSLLELES